MTRRPHTAAARGFTLLEALATVALLSVLFALLANWASGWQRMLVNASDMSQDSRVAYRLADAMRRDIESAAEASVLADFQQQTLMMKTCNSFAGDTPGWAEVTWGYDASGDRLMRDRALESTGVASRRVLALSGVRWSLEPTGSGVVVYIGQEHGIQPLHVPEGMFAEEGAE